MQQFALIFAVSPSNGFPFKARPLRQFKSYRLMHSNVLIVTQGARNVSFVEKKKNRICCPFFFPLPLFHNNAWRRGEVSSVEKGFVGDSFFYSFLYVFTNLLLIWSRASLGLSDIWGFFSPPPPRPAVSFFCFVLFWFCAFVLLISSLLNPFCELLSPPLFFDSWTL